MPSFRAPAAPAVLAVTVVLAACVSANPEQAPSATAAPVKGASTAPSTTGSTATEPSSPGVLDRDRGSDDAPDPERDAALIAAAANGDTLKVRDLLGLGADVTARDPAGRTALVAAAYGNHLGTARALIGAGADVNTPDETQQSAYLIATSEVGDDPRLLELTLTAGADVQAKDSYNGTGLIRAAERGHPRIVARLLEADIQVDHVNRLGWTALLEAVILGQGGVEHVETVRALIGAGADLDLPDRDGVTAFEHAERRGHEQIAGLLRAAGARADAGS